MLKQQHKARVKKYSAQLTIKTRGSGSNVLNMGSWGGGMEDEERNLW